MSIPEELKNKLLVEARHECVICGESGVQIHHIDGNHNNNDESNLIVLCLNHHDEAEKSKQGRGLSANLTIRQLQIYKQKTKAGVDLFKTKRGWVGSASTCSTYPLLCPPISPAGKFYW